MFPAKTAILFATAYVVIYAVVINLDVPVILAPIGAVLWLFVFLWMVYCILKDTRRPYPKLKENEEWGYLDKNKNELGMF
ncbi:hypothetical protein [Mucilaginibacter xinganensis]|uniref:Uncharacterized protein n=1 Tax=Mucilaginibacter xinganensis TaxID=1234841 RepID=A0A223P390_9SPHI|nr:hypothetical protein [Mucilaginibacter xinganensis]ASU36552.1 hypothetical protein MuYL_4669 [Mucilaginibacter xinganensis]